MSFDPFNAEGQAYPLAEGRPPIVLSADGMDHPHGARGKRREFTSYRDITHLTTTDQAAWIATKKSVYILPRSMFVQTGGPETVVQALARRIALLPGGSEQIDRMTEVDRRSAEARPLRATLGLTGICIAVCILQLWLGPNVEAVANYRPIFFEAGDTWRIVTANLVHAAPEFPVHLILNMLALVVLGALVERPLGVARTLTVMGASGVGAMFASGLFGGYPVVGASGVVFGLVGAAVWLEFTWADRLPAWWRYPRRSLIILLVLNGVLGFLVPIISGSAHFGGFLAGLAATACVAGGGRGMGEPAAWVKASAMAVLASVVLAVGAAGFELAKPGDYAARHAARLAILPEVNAFELNDAAWLIAISKEPSVEMVEAARLLAERAVAETDREDPNILDTLAEVLFVLGEQEEALAVIDEAIDKAPDESYFREQRRRFTGERDSEDRPAAPMPSWVPRPFPELPSGDPDEPEGIAI